MQKKGLISYYKKNGIITFNKHVNVNHAIIAKTLRMKSIIQSKNYSKVINKKKIYYIWLKNFNVFCYKRSFKKDDVLKKIFFFTRFEPFDHQKSLINA
jgi:hypothetical protein